MQTTITLDDDIAETLRWLQKDRGSAMDQLINDAARQGLKKMRTRRKHTQSFRTKSVSLGRVHLPIIDSVAEAVAIAERESLK
jgi:hypothetical protein